MSQIEHSKDHWDANFYDSNHSFVSKFGSDLIELLAPLDGEQVLDIGCGTGDLAAKLTKLNVHVTGIDKSENMILQAQNKYPHLNFSVKDVLSLDYYNKFDAVFSNATLHWVKSPKQALHSIYNSLKSGGRFVAEFGGKGNVICITNATIHAIETNGIEYDAETFPWYFPSIGEYSSLMEEVGFNVKFAHHFSRPTPLIGEEGLRNWIQMFCGSMLEDIPEEKMELIFSTIEDSLRSDLFIDGTWVADYQRIRVIGVK
ncbi:class I SAM-dependent methyltransferase [Bacillus sp. Marseille-P3661]|uniref:class I SAM-dependent methyltransferase n=1 Tax=Bacillus sp. Marseille-P3661 TaxID=1936234 RepID=UPI000C83ED56|nr:class I SAM-dependent methyltransferase [Bacillus sp. Marseille-P3661]